MEVEVRIPATLREYTAGAVSVVAEGDTLAEVFDNLGMMYEGLRSEILDDQGEIHPFVNIFLNGEDIRFLEELSTGLKEGDVISILPAVAGGDSFTGGFRITGKTEASRHQG